MLYLLTRILIQLSCVFPRLSSSKASQYAETMSSMLGGSVLSNTCHWAAFLGNVGTERFFYSAFIFHCTCTHSKITDLNHRNGSAGLTEWTQIPCNSGDDAPYCGRGPLQITGSSNYKYCARQPICGCSGIASNPESVSDDVQTGHLP